MDDSQWQFALTVGFFVNSLFMYQFYFSCSMAKLSEYRLSSIIQPHSSKIPLYNSVIVNTRIIQSYLMSFMIFEYELRLYAINALLRMVFYFLEKKNYDHKIA